ncbi:MAG: hypothetical protein K5897_02465 [Eubacterium sp.]|nr:hypothetical protein [Eubacterium sp.]
MLKSLEAAKVGVLMGGGVYDRACDAVKALETSCKKWLDTLADGPSPEKGNYIYIRTKICYNEPDTAHEKKYFLS